MFERFTDRARRIVVLAQEEARLMQLDYIGTEHLLLAMIHEGESVASIVLTQRFSLDLEQMRSDVMAMIEAEAADDRPGGTGHIPFTPRAKKVVELSLREALQLGHNYIGTEHILLALIREGEGIAAQVLVKAGLDLAAVRQEVIMVLTAYDEVPVASARRVAPEQLARLRDRGDVSAGALLWENEEHPLSRSTAKRFVDWASRFDGAQGPLSDDHPLKEMAMWVRRLTGN